MRRTVLMMMACDSAALLAIRVEAPDTFRDMVAAAHDYAKHAEDARKMAQAAMARLALIELS